MPILVDSTSRVLCYGMETLPGLFHIQQCLAYGTNIVGCVAPTKGGQEVLGCPMFASMREARKKTGSNVLLLFVEPAAALEAILEAEYAGIELIVCLSGNVPMHDMAQVRKILLQNGRTRLIGPKSVGVISPGQCKAGSMPAYMYTPGCCGIISTSGTLMYEAVLQTSGVGLGQSTCVDIGADALIGSSVTDLLVLLNRDPETKAILLLGPFTRTDEEELLEWTRSFAQKPVLSYLPGKIATERHTSGVYFVENLIRLGDAVKKVLSY